jgi:F0F1-type ATP synthase epsilon subunit
MHLSIYSLQETLFEGQVVSVNLPTPLGEMTVLNHHIPLVSIISPGEICCVLPDSTIKTLPFHGGILEVRPQSNVVVLANP